MKKIKIFAALTMIMLPFLTVGVYADTSYMPELTSTVKEAINSSNAYLIKKSVDVYGGIEQTSWAVFVLYTNSYKEVGYSDTSIKNRYLGTPASNVKEVFYYFDVNDKGWYRGSIYKYADKLTNDGIDYEHLLKRTDTVLYSSFDKKTDNFDVKKKFIQPPVEVALKQLQQKVIMDSGTISLTGGIILGALLVATLVTRFRTWALR